MTVAELVAALRERGLITADLPPSIDEADRPWFISLLMGIAGWIAGLFVLVFIALLLDLQNREQILVAGVVLLAVAWALYAIGRGKVFVDQLALAFSIAGQLAVTAYLIQQLDFAVFVTAAILGMQLLLFLVMPDRVARLLAALFAAIAWVLLLRFLIRPDEGTGDYFDGPIGFVSPVFGAWAPALEALFTWTPLCALVVWLRRTETRWMGRRLAHFARPAIVGLLLALSLGAIAAEPFTTLDIDHGGFTLDFNAWALLPLLSIALALFSAFNAFVLRSSGLLGVAIVAALVHLGRFYWLYGATLTVKSAIMLGAGLVLLGAGRLLARRVETPA